MAHKKWTEEKIREEAKKYKTRNAFKKNSNGAYSTACKRGILDDICSHMTPSKTAKKWTNGAIRKEAKKYKTRHEFAKKAGGAYGTACGRGILDVICSHMVPADRTRKWTNDAIRKEAKKYDTRSEFQKHSNGAYQAARRRGILDDICNHMPKHVKA